MAFVEMLLKIKAVESCKVLENMPQGAHTGLSANGLAASVRAPGEPRLQLLPAHEPAGGGLV